MTQPNSIVVVNEYGSHHPYGFFYRNGSFRRRLRTEVIDSPTRGLVTLQQAKIWLDQDEDATSDLDINGLILAASNYLCGPNSETSKCFRKWRLADYFELRTINKNNRFLLNYPITQSIESIGYINTRTQVKTNIPTGFRLRKRNMQRSELIFYEDQFDAPDDIELTYELEIVYNSSARLDEHSNPVIDPLLIQVCKHLIAEGFEKDGMTYGPSQGSGAINKYVDRIVNSFYY